MGLRVLDGPCHWITLLPHRHPPNILEEQQRIRQVCPEGVEEVQYLINRSGRWLDLADQGCLIRPQRKSKQGPREVFLKRAAKGEVRGSGIRELAA